MTNQSDPKMDKIQLRRTEVAPKSRNGATALALSGVVAGMLGLAFASDPLYRIFCQVTGYGGTTQVAEAAPGSKVIDQMITVRFDANVNKSLPLQFKPVQNTIKVRLGEQALAFYEATNTSDKAIVGTATFNVAPYKVGEYFNKIECFCFTEQVLRPGETVQMPVTFFVDPEMLKDRNAKMVRTLTLSYTFFADDDQSEALKLETTEVIVDPKDQNLISREVTPKG